MSENLIFNKTVKGVSTDIQNILTRTKKTTKKQFVSRLITISSEPLFMEFEKMYKMKKDAYIHLLST